MKILYVTTVGITMSFFKSFIAELKNSGHEVDLACNDSLYPVAECYREWGCKLHTLSCRRSPFNFGVLKAIKEIKSLVKKEQYDIVHCHTPIAAMCTRLACAGQRKKGLKVIYTAHGFHFYKGAPKKNWLIYYPIEKICSYFTDVLITINKEDYALANKKFRAKKVVYVPGVGIDVDKFRNCDVLKEEKRKAIGIPEDATLFLSVGELNANKNHASVIRAIAVMEDEGIHYAVAGDGDLKDYLLALSKELGMEQRVHLLGRRSDVAELYKAAECYVHPSFREGLPVAVMEAMAAGLPVAASRIRGNVDLIDEKGGVLFSPHSVDVCRCAIQSLLKEDLLQMGNHNQEKIKDYSQEKIHEMMLSIYLDKGI